VNDDQKLVMFRKISDHYKGSLKGKTVAMWGLSFKPQTDDMREAPSLVLIDALLGAGARVKAYDPVAMHEAQRIVGDRITYATGLYDAIDGADCLLMVTEWPEFRFPDFGEVKRLLKAPVVFDGRNIYDLTEMKKLGFQYYCIGINTPSA
jgi:UDPglucose 6-dehydrogenase